MCQGKGRDDDDVMCVCNESDNPWSTVSRVMTDESDEVNDY